MQHYEQIAYTLRAHISFFVRWLYFASNYFYVFHSCIPSPGLLSRSWVKVKRCSKLCEGQPLCHISALRCCLVNNVFWKWYFWRHHNSWVGRVHGWRSQTKDLWTYLWPSFFTNLRGILAGRKGGVQRLGGKGVWYGSKGYTISASVTAIPYRGRVWDRPSFSEEKCFFT